MVARASDIDLGGARSMSDALLRRGSLRRLVAPALVAVVALVATGASPAAADSARAGEPNLAGAGQAQASIVEGAPASIAAFPWLAHVGYEGRRLAFACTGTMVAPRLVLTAAHCLLREGGGVGKAANYRVVTGAANLERAGPENISRVSRVLVFPRYKPGRNLNDAGLLVLSAPVSAPGLPLATPAEGHLLAKGTRMTIAGWGRTDRRSNRTPKVLRQAETTIQGVRSCRRRTRFLPAYAPAAQFCAVSAPRFEVGSCQGDSGGPGIVRRADGSLVQVGIVSAGEPDCNPREPEVLARVDRVSGWVAQWIAAVETGGQAPPVLVPKVVLPRMSVFTAKIFAVLGLRKDFGRRFRRGKDHDVHACKRIEREKVKCAVAWSRGRNDYSGTITVFWAYDEDGTLWKYRYRIRRVDHRCRLGERRHCAFHTRRR